MKRNQGINILIYISYLLSQFISLIHHATTTLAYPHFLKYFKLLESSTLYFLFSLRRPLFPPPNTTNNLSFKSQLQCHPFKKDMTLKVDYAFPKAQILFFIEFFLLLWHLSQYIIIWARVLAILLYVFPHYHKCHEVRDYKLYWFVQHFITQAYDK